jgi:two-component system response regulator AtoC
VTIGRAEDNDIRIDDASVSRRHARLLMGPPLRVEDVGSANGIRLTTHRASPGTAELIETRVPARGSLEVAPGDRIVIGATVLIVQLAQRSDDDRESSSGIVRSFVSPVIEDGAMRKLHEMASRVAQSPINVLLLGETGVGKEVMAEAIHRSSARAQGPLVCINCAALSESLLERELFGHEAGAFTGASRAKPGLLETAEGGTIFLDEVGELPVPTQVKLLRVLEERKVLRVGGLSKRDIDVRFIAATSRDLEEEVRRRTFQKDVYFRLNGISLTIPPLRERITEIEPLARSFLSRVAAQMQLGTEPTLSPAALDALERYAWPGNIRELRNVIERAVVLCVSDTIMPAHLGLGQASQTEPIDEAPSERSTLLPSISPRSRMGEDER